MENNVQVPNLGGSSELFIMADLVRSAHFLFTINVFNFFFKQNHFCFKARPYWAKDLIFLITDVGYAGTQAFINSYFDLKSPCNYKC